MRKAPQPNPHQKGGGAGGQQKMNPQYPRGVRPGGPGGAGAPNNNNNNKMMNSGGAPPPRRQGIPQQQQNVPPPPLHLMNAGYPTMTGERVGYVISSGNAGDASHVPLSYSIVTQQNPMGARTPSNPAGAAHVNNSGAPQQQLLQQGNEGPGAQPNGSNAGQVPTRPQVTSASPPLMQQGGGGQNPQQQQPPQQQQQVSNVQQQQGPPQGQHSQQVAQQPQIMMGHHPYYMQKSMPQHQALMQHAQMTMASHVPGLHPQQSQPPPNSSGSGNQGSNNSIVGGSGGVGQQAGNAGVSNASGHQYQFMVPSGPQHMQAAGPNGPFMQSYPTNLPGIQGGSGSSGSNAPNSVVGVNSYQFIHPGSQIVLGTPQPTQGLHHHQMHGAGGGPSMVMTQQLPDMRPMMGMMPQGQQHPGPGIFLPQVQQTAPQPPPVKRERKGLVITDPKTGEDVVKKWFEEQEDKSGGTSSASSTAASTTTSATTTAGATKPASTGIVMSYPPGQRPSANASGVRMSPAPATAAPAAATKEPVNTDVTPTVSANLDLPDEFLPHLQKASEAKVVAPANTNVTSTVAPAATVTEVAPAVAPVVAETTSTEKPAVVVEPEATQTKQAEKAGKQPEKKAEVVVPEVVKAPKPVAKEAVVEQPKAKLPAQGDSVVEKQNAASAKESKVAAAVVVEQKSEQVAAPEAKTTVPAKSSNSSNSSNKGGVGNGQEAKVTSSSGKKNEPAAKSAADQVSSSSAAVTVDEIDRAAAPASQASVVKPEVAEAVTAAKMVVPTEEVAPSSIPKEEKEMINFKKEKEASAAEEQEAAKPTKSADKSKAPVEDAENVKEAGSEKPGAVKLVLQYEEGQWSPLNVTGRKVYTMDQMRLLQTQPISQAQPEKGIEDSFIRANPESKKIQSSSGGSGGGGGGGGGGVVNNLLFPHFYADQFAGMQRPNNYNSKRNHSQTGSNVPEGKKPIIITLSLNNDIKLNQAENAWRPSMGAKKSAVAKVETEDTRTEEEKETEDVYKKFRIILNKLTPENFKKLTEDVKALPINTAERVNGCMQMVFEKAVIEPNYTLTYAVLCKEVSQLGPSRAATPSNKKEEDFKAIMLQHCQKHFECLSNLDDTRKKRLERVAKLKAAETGNAEKDAEMMAELKATVEEEERKERHRSVGIVRFIGELFKQQWITQSIIYNCTEVLLRNRDEEYLECLCKLLTTVGPKIDEVQQFKSCWAQLQETTEGKDKNKLSSRVRFMILDLLDLRRNKWVPRRAESKPQAISQIHKEEERAFQSNQEEVRFAAMASGRGSMSKNTGGSGGGGGMMNMGGGSRTSSQGGDNDQRSYNKNSQRGRRGNEGRDNRSSYNDRNTGNSSNSASDANNQGSNNNADDGEWIKAPTKRQVIDPAKFKPKTQVIDDSTKLGSAVNYRNFAQTKNAYATLQEIDTKDSGSSNSDLYPRNSMERDRYDGRGSSHKSSRENSSSRMGGGYDSRDRSGSSMNYNRNNDRGSGGGGGGGGRGGDRNQSRQFMGGSSSTSSYSSSQRYDDDDRSGKGGGRAGSRGGNGGPMQSSNRSQGGSTSVNKGSLHGSKSIGESSRPLKMEVMDAPVREAGSIQDTDPNDQSFLDLTVSDNILKKVLTHMIDSSHKPEDYKTELGKLAQKSMMGQADATPVQVVKKQVYDIICMVMERKEKGRQLCGQLLAYCLNNKFLSRSVFVSSLGQFLVSAEDFIIDVPKVYQYIPEFLGPAMLESQINLTDVAHALEIVRDSDSPTSGVDNVILELGKYFAEIRKPEVLFEMWSLDKLSWSKFVLRYDNEDKLKEDFLVPNNLYYICNESALNELRSSWGLGAQEGSTNGQEDLEKALDKLLEGDFDVDAVQKWIKAHFKSTDEDFIKFLSMAIIRTTVDDSSKYNLKSPSFEKKLNLLQTHFGDRRTLEMQVAALHGIQHVDFQLEHPKELLKNVFAELYHLMIISKEAFYEWKNSTKQPEGKGVAEKMLSNFFVQMANDGSDEEDSPAD